MAEIKASKVEVLDFIRRRQAVVTADLVNGFGYSYWGAYNKLRRLHRDHLIKRLARGEYCLADDGYLKLVYYKKI